MTDFQDRTYRSRCSLTGRGWMTRLFGMMSLVLLTMSALADDEVVEKSIFLVFEDDKVIASNVATGQFFDFRFSAKERVLDTLVANGVAILVTNQRFAGVGVFSSGWQSIRRIAGEDLTSAEAQDYSALVVTSDRVLSYNGRTGTWSHRKR